MTSPHPDTRYITALLTNDYQGIAEIYTRFIPVIERMVQRNSGHSDDARDVFQEALLAITRRAGQRDFVLTCPFEAYLWCVCRGKWLNELERRRRERVTFQGLAGYETSEDAEALAEAALFEENRDQLFHQSFEKLSASCRQLLQLAWTGISMGQVSQQLNISYSFARKRKSECIAKLARYIKSAPPTHDE